MLKVKEAIEKRRAYRSLDPFDSSDDIIRDLALSAGLAPSCFNYQPWRFIFVRDQVILSELHGALSKTNAWAQRASMLIAVFSKADDDCQVRGRIYHQFDTGIALGFLIIRATELNLVAHPFAGFREKKVKEILGIPEEYQVIAMVALSKKAEVIYDLLTDSQKGIEKKRPERKSIEEYVNIDRFE